MSSTSSSSSSSSSTSSSTPYDAVAPDIPGPSTRRTTRSGQFEASSSSSQRQRAMNEVLPEPLLEALATQLALDAANYNGRLSAASALAILFQVATFLSSSSLYISPLISLPHLTILLAVRVVNEDKFFFMIAHIGWLCLPC